MKVKELKEILSEYRDDEEIMYWDAEECKHYPPVISPNYKDNDKNGIKIIEIDRYC